MKGEFKMKEKCYFCKSEEKRLFNYKGSLLKACMSCCRKWTYAWDCFNGAFVCSLDLIDKTGDKENIKIVHGIVRGLKRHAWVEFNNQVHDWALYGKNHAPIERDEYHKSEAVTFYEEYPCGDYFKRVFEEDYFGFLPDIHRVFDCLVEIGMYNEEVGEQGQRSLSVRVQ
jgi:hypothetical protein